MGWIRTHTEAQQKPNHLQYSHVVKISANSYSDSETAKTLCDHVNVVRVRTPYSIRNLDYFFSVQQKIEIQQFDNKLYAAENAPTFS